MNQLQLICTAVLSCSIPAWQTHVYHILPSSADSDNFHLDAIRSCGRSVKNVWLGGAVSSNIFRHILVPCHIAATLCFALHAEVVTMACNGLLPE